MRGRPPPSTQLGMGDRRMPEAAARCCLPGKAAPWQSRSSEWGVRRRLSWGFFLVASL